MVETALFFRADLVRGKKFGRNGPFFRAVLSVFRTSRGSKRRRLTEEQQSAKDLMMAVKARLANPVQASRDEFHVYGEMLGNELRGMDEDQCIFSKRLMQEVIFMAKRKKLSDSSSIVNISSTADFLA